jgi:nicotinate-nucleotide adenylyltransferase
VVGLLGGSFDPVHHGHLLTGVVLGECLGLGEVRFMPARSQPFKASHSAPIEHRVRMVELAVADSPGLAVELAEIERSGPSFTVDTLRSLREREPDETWALLVGADAAGAFEQWKEADAILSMASVVFFSRAGSPPVRIPGADYLEVPAIDISATEIRTRVRAGRSIRYWVPEVVADYVAAHRLFAETDG